MSEGGERGGERGEALLKAVSSKRVRIETFPTPLSYLFFCLLPFHVFNLFGIGEGIVLISWC